ncbi:MAG: hypothetical protein U5K81_08190 [Trueperaceae bacterium]|nr:hypothetical protein [Trueperaceae bacterium]
MQLVALLGTDPTARALARFRDPEGRVWLHPAPPGDIATAVAALPVLGFAGALVFGDEARRDAAAATTRRSLEGSDLGVVDAVAVAGDSTIGDFVTARALLDGLQAGGWEPRGARIAALGGGAVVRGTLRELATAGAADIALIAPDAPTAEHALPDLPAGVRGRAVAAADPTVPTLLERCDLLLRSENLASPHADALGPHLTVLDLAPGLAPDWRTEVRAAGGSATAFPDIAARTAAAALRTVVGGEVGVEPLLDLLHET